MTVSYDHIGVIFDCDGTLLDSVGAWRHIERDLAQQAGIKLTKEDVDALTSFTIPESAAYYHSKYHFGESPEQVLQMIDDFMISFYQNHVEARPGALEFVQSLAQKGVRMAIASASPHRYLAPGLERTGFMPYLEAVVSTDDVAKSKRDPDVFDYALTLIGTPHQATWVFEDSAYALHTLRKAGYHTVGIHDCDTSGTFEELAAVADITIHQYSELSADKFASYAHDLHLFSQCALASVS